MAKKTKVFVPVQIEGRTKKEKWIIKAGDHEFTDKQLLELKGHYNLVEVQADETESESAELDTDPNTGGDGKQGGDTD